MRDQFEDLDWVFQFGGEELVETARIGFEYQRLAFVHIENFLNGLIDGLEPRIALESLNLGESMLQCVENILIGETRLNGILAG